jgi:hypothetical protein
MQGVAVRAIAIPAVGDPSRCAPGIPLRSGLDQCAEYDLGLGPLDCQCWAERGTLPLLYSVGCVYRPLHSRTLNVNSREQHHNKKPNRNRITV